MTNGEWRMANGEWRMGNGEWRMANGEIANLEEVSSYSPGLRGTSYPGFGFPRAANPERVASSSGIESFVASTPSGLPRIRDSQGSSYLATLGYRMEPLRGWPPSPLSREDHCQ